MILVNACLSFCIENYDPCHPQLLGYPIWLQIGNGDTICIFSDKPGAPTRALVRERKETLLSTAFSLSFSFSRSNYIPYTSLFPSLSFSITSMKLSVLAFLLVALFAMLAQADLQDEIDQAMKKFCGGNLSSLLAFIDNKCIYCRPLWQVSRSPNQARTKSSATQRKSKSLSVSAQHSTHPAAASLFSILLTHPFV